MTVLSVRIHEKTRGALHPLDLALLSTVEKARLKTPLLSFLNWTEIPSDRLLSLASYVGIASSGAGENSVTKRYDIDSLLSEVRGSNAELEEDYALVKSHLMFSVECVTTARNLLVPPLILLVRLARIEVVILKYCITLIH